MLAVPSPNFAAPPRGCALDTPMAEEDECPPGPRVDVERIELTPPAECAFEEAFGLVMEFSMDTPLVDHCWRLSCTVDTSKRRKILDLGATEAASYPPGAHSMSYYLPGRACPTTSSRR